MVANHMTVVLGDAGRWRLHMAERIASELDMPRFGVKGVYLFGSTELGCAGQGSDIDLIVHVAGNRQQNRLLREWFAGWDKALCSLDELITGRKPSYILDVHYVTEQDIRNRECFAAKIDAVDEPATLLRA